MWPHLGKLLFFLRLDEDVVIGCLDVGFETRLLFFQASARFELVLAISLSDFEPASEGGDNAFHSMFKTKPTHFHCYQSCCC